MGYQNTNGLTAETGSDCNRVRIGGTTTLHGDPRIRTEKPHTIIKFPGGNVEISRTSDNRYWIHVAVKAMLPDETPGRVVGARIDFDGRYGDEANEVLRREVEAGDVTHIAFLVEPGEG